MFKETIEEIRDKVVELDNIYSDAIAVDAVSCSSVIHEFVEDIQKKLDELIELENKKRISLSCKIIDELQDSREKVEELRKQIEEKDARIEELKEDLEDANKKAQKELNELRDEYHEQLKLHYGELKATKKELARKDEKIEKLYHDLDDSDREIDNLREDNVALVERIEKLENERRISIPCKIIDELQDSREKVEELTKHNDDLRRDNEFIGRLIEGKNERLLQLERDLKAANQKIEKLNVELYAARISSGTRMGMMYIDSKSELELRTKAFKAIYEAIKKLDEEVVSKVNKEI